MQVIKMDFATIQKTTIAGLLNDHVDNDSRDKGSYQLSHIYDNLFARNLSGERRLDRPFRRRPSSRPKRQL